MVSNKRHREREKERERERERNRERESEKERRREQRIFVQLLFSLTGIVYSLILDSEPWSLHIDSMATEFA